MDLDDHTRANLANWNERVSAHAASPDYDLDALVDDPAHLSGPVQFDRERMGDVAGQRLLHLQCHIGTDTVSWGKLGAHVTGLDFSAPALEVARDLAARAGVADARFVESTVDDAPSALAGEVFDVVYTGIGALCWLPDMGQWARVVASLLAPGGRLFIREGHPALWSLDYERDDEVLALAFPWFTQPEPTRWDEDPASSYVAVPAGTQFAHTISYDWNHGIGEIITAVLDAGLVLDAFVEHREVPWKPFGLFEACADHPGEYVLPDRLRELAPMTYTLVAHRP